MVLLSRLVSASAGGASTIDPSWDIDYLVYNGLPFNELRVNSQDTTPEGIFLKPDGTKMYIAGTFANTIREYDLSTPWDITTASYSKVFDMSAEVQSVSGMFFKDDGLKLFTINLNTDAVWSYDLES